MTKRERTLAVLWREGLVGPGTRLVVHPGHINGPWPTTLGESALHASLSEDLARRENVVWEADGGSYSLTALRNILLDRGAPLSQGMVYEHWALAEQPELSLWEVAERLGRRTR